MTDLDTRQLINRLAQRIPFHVIVGGTCIFGTDPNNLREKMRQAKVPPGSYEVFETLFQAGEFYSKRVWDRIEVNHDGPVPL